MDDVGWVHVAAQADQGPAVRERAHGNYGEPLIRAAPAGFDLPLTCQLSCILYEALGGETCLGSGTEQSGLA